MTEALTLLLCLLAGLFVCGGLIVNEVAHQFAFSTRRVAKGFMVVGFVLILIASYLTVTS